MLFHRMHLCNSNCRYSFVFFKQKTAYEMRISDWSSDVCSSDLDQGFEHGPARSFAVNPDAYDPHYHYQLALDAGMSAYAAPLGMIEAGADSFAGQLPPILKVNSANSWATARDQAVTGGVDAALRLGCAAIGFTV